ncbi:MAG: hypothetical protein H6721_09885 [Sandaracinus sp.]|nr:hypothetical protein [Sandaracinus sp.]MCB9616042.1 hypothetical protein [Sandaracinus sp.]MCB9632425.1 hypothetical protein [Sandaracinus sp.]
MRSLLASFCLVLAACGGADIGERCSSDDDCSNGLVCWEWPCVGDSCARSCEQGCTDDAQCSDGRICSGMLCTRVE